MLHASSHAYLQHRLQVLGNGEWCLGLALDLLHCHTVGNLNQLETVGKVNVKDTLNELVSMKIF
jgi:hypothetical protein